MKYVKIVISGFISVHATPRYVPRDFTLMSLRTRYFTNVRYAMSRESRFNLGLPGRHRWMARPRTLSLTCPRCTALRVRRTFVRHPDGDRGTMRPGAIRRAHLLQMLCGD